MFVNCELFLRQIFMNIRECNVTSLKFNAIQSPPQHFHIKNPFRSSDGQPQYANFMLDSNCLTWAGKQLPKEQNS